MYFLPTALKRSSIPISLLAEVGKYIASISLAKALASSSWTVSLSNKSHLFPAIPMTKMVIKNLTCVLFAVVFQLLIPVIFYFFKGVSSCYVED